jgi:hypothetical protein
LKTLRNFRSVFFVQKTIAFNGSNTVTHPGLRPPLQRRGTHKIPSTGGVPGGRGGFLNVLQNGISIVKCSNRSGPGSENHEKKLKLIHAGLKAVKFLHRRNNKTAISSYIK